MTGREKNGGNFKMVNTIKVDIASEQRPDGSFLLHSKIPLSPFPYRLTDRMRQWSAHTPDRVFMGRRDPSGAWKTLTYSQAFQMVQHLGQALLDRGVSVQKPLAILSGNSIEHALLALAAMHTGLPHSSISTGYSLRSTDFSKLRHALGLLDPGLIFVDDAKKYDKALQHTGEGIEIVTVINRGKKEGLTPFEAMLETTVTAGVERAYQAIRPETVGKILFTSGSTGLPKGVMNTHENISTNWQQITQTFPFLQEPGLEFLDWLPWNHTFGGNHNLGLSVFNGGSFYIDDGNPTPEGIDVTISNLRERNPTIYFNVPKGFEVLLPYFREDLQLARKFFSNLKMLFYAGAGMPQHVWDAWENLSLEITGRKVLIATGLGCTESSPSALFASEPDGFAGLLGVPVPGLELKLTPVGAKLEARYRGKNIFPGYWKQPELTSAVFDEEGFYCTGDALRFYDQTDVNRGLIFDGRFAEDFKLGTGTWVRVGLLRSQVIAAGKGMIQDVVVAGHDRNFISVIVFPAIEFCRKRFGLSSQTDLNTIIQQDGVRQHLYKSLEELSLTTTGSSNFVRRAVFADFELSMDKGEITDKGTINQ